jgi:hypothetical protein
VPADDFDFLFGRWDVAHRKLRDATDPTCDDWVDLAGSCEAWPLLSTGGHVDRFVVPEQPGTDAFEGSTLRLLDPATDLWSIFWSSTRAPGTLDPAVVGRFEGEVGTFTGAEVIGGRRVLIRFTWSRGETPRWQQEFSYDAGATWSVNWTMDFTRA